MTTTTLIPPRRVDRPHAGGHVSGLLSDVWSMTRRNLVHISREPMQLSDVTIQPVLFTVLFIYIFGGGIPIPGGGSYKDFAAGRILALNLTTSIMGTAVGLSTDLHEGVIDRFRTLPMWRSAVLVGRSIADLLTSVVCAAIVALTGLAVGWRPDANAISVIGGFGLLLFFGYSMSLGGGLRGTEQQGTRVGGVVRFHRAVPAGLRLQRHGADPAHAGLAPGRGQLEPGERGRRRRPPPVRQSQSVGHGAGLADAAPGGSGAHLVAWRSWRWRPAGGHFFKKRTTESARCRRLLQRSLLAG